MQTLVVVLSVLGVAALFIGGFILDRKNRSAAASKADEATEREWFHAIR